MNKLRSVAAVSVGAALMLSACSSGGGTQSDEGAASGDKGSGTITLMASQGWVKDPELELAKKFEEETGIHVDYQISPADQYQTLLTTKLNSGEAADIFMNQAGKFDIVTQMQIERNGVDLTDQEWVGRMEPAVKEQVSVGDKVYGMTIWDVADSYVYLYNKKMFDELGIDVPTSYDTFKEACAKLVAAGVTPIYESMADGWHHQLNFVDVSAAYDASNPNLVEELNNNETTFAEAGVFKEVVEQMKEVYDAGYWGEYAESNVGTDMVAEMTSGNYGMTVAPMAYISQMDGGGGEYGSDDFGIFAAPYLDNTLISETPVGPSKFVFSGSKNADAAKQYLAFLAEPENLQYIIDNDQDVNALPFDGITPTFTPVMAEAIERLKPGTSTVYQNVVNYLNPQWMEIGADLAAYFGNDMTADEVIANIDQRRADQAEIAKDPNWN